MRPRRYAEGTKVRVSRSIAEIAEVLADHQFRDITTADRDLFGAIGGMREGHLILFRLDYPARDAEEFSRGRPALSQRRLAWEAEVRRLWRALLLYVKGLLEAVREGVVSFEDAVLPHIVLKDGQTVAESVRPQLPVLSAGVAMSVKLPMLCAGIR